MRAQYIDASKRRGPAMAHGHHACVCPQALSSSGRTKAAAALVPHIRSLLCGFLPCIPVSLKYFFLGKPFLLLSAPSVKRGWCSKLQLRLQIDHSLPDPYLTRM